jgi:uncharacterized membrane protein YciS (DUF1049 family)
MLLRADKMLEAMVVFLAGFACGIIAGRVYFKQQTKIKFYELYIHRRLKDTLPQTTRDLGPARRLESSENIFG